MGSIGIVTSHSDGNFLLSSETKSFMNMRLDPKDPKKEVPDFIAVTGGNGRTSFRLRFSKETTRDDYERLMNGWRGKQNVIDSSSRSSYDKALRDAKANNMSLEDAAVRASSIRDLSVAKAFQKHAAGLGVDITIQGGGKTLRSTKHENFQQGSDKRQARLNKAASKTSRKKNK